YDMEVLQNTLQTMRIESEKYGFEVHYAVKANFNRRIMETISGFGFGADCVSGNEIDLAIETGFHSSDIVFAGVGKTDREIEFALDSDIACFNCESCQEISVIADIAARKGKIASVAIRINPNVDAFTHNYITTGVEESKFGILMSELDEVIALTTGNPNLRLRGIHFHIGSQILNLSVFKSLCVRINELQDWFTERNIDIDIINVGGGLGIDHYYPDTLPLFREYFEIFGTLLKRKEHQKVFFEIGRAAVGQSGSLITKVLYTKERSSTKFAIVDAGMTDLIRPSLYQAFHLIENLTSAGSAEKYSVVGPVCESADIFGKMVDLPETKRGDILAIRSAGAYGEVMSSRYNMRDLPRAVFSDTL
ncbi:MAG: diaminopimelate decarboxylase, partial [Bacteroidales bacterium]|nr:diaminopimelate decarboxylase [Bacteroidales bacterium]